MIKIQKINHHFFLIFCLLFVNVLSIIQFQQNVSAKDVIIYNDSEKNEVYNYNLQIPTENNSYASRVAQENFNYATGMSLTNRENVPSGFTAVITTFNDTDFLGTNNRYQSKMCLLQRISTVANYATIRYLTNTIQLEAIRTRFIIKPLNCATIQILFYSGSTIYNIYVRLNNRDIFAQKNYVTLQSTNSTFLSNKNLYEFLYIEYDTLEPTTIYDINLRCVGYNASGLIIFDRIFYITAYDIYRKENINRVALQYNLPYVNDWMWLITEDYNILSNNFHSYQKPIVNNDYNSMSSRQFYLTHIYNNVPELTSQSTSSTLYYATTKTLGRYLNYETNATQLGNNGFLSSRIEESLNTQLYRSFSMDFEFQQNLGYNESNFYFKFAHTYFSFNTSWALDGYYYFSFGLGQFNSASIFNQTQENFNRTYNSGKYYNWNMHIKAQFRNRIFLIALYYNNYIFAFQRYLDEEFSNISIIGCNLVDYNIKALESEKIIEISNSTNILILTDIFTFTDRVLAITTYKAFSDSFYISDNSISTIYDSNGRQFDLIGSNIISMQFYSERNAVDGLFEISSDNGETFGLFNGNDLNGTLDQNLLLNRNSGNIFLKARFWSISVEQLVLEIQITITRLCIFTDEIPSQNLLINKALEFLLPLSIFGMIIIGFKSNSDSKWLGFVGIYVALFVFYLMEYMSLLFLILCIIMQTIGLYIIIKNEKNEGI